MSFQDLLKGSFESVMNALPSSVRQEAKVKKWRMCIYYPRPQKFHLNGPYERTDPGRIPCVVCFYVRFYARVGTAGVGCIHRSFIEEWLCARHRGIGCQAHRLG